MNIKKVTPKYKVLAQQTFDALAPWINIQCSGKWHIPNVGNPHPIYFIKQEAYELGQRWKNGEHHLFYKDGSRFFPSHLKAWLRPRHIDEMIGGNGKFYYTGGRHGQTLLMIDIDAHEPWQTDAKETMLQVVDILGADKCFVVESTRGYNIFVKWRYLELADFMIFRPSAWQQANRTILSLQSALKRHTAHSLSCVEVKGTISVSSEHYGSLAKLPCFGTWTEARLNEFRNLPILDSPWLESKIQQIEKNETKSVKEKSKVKTGSCDSFNLSQDDIDSIPKFVKILKSRSWYCDNRKVDLKRKDVKLVSLDFAYGFVVLSLARKYRKAKFGEQMPTKFIQIIWNHLYEAGIFSRAFDSSRWAGIRDTLADCGFLLFVSNRYWFDGRGEKRGKAMEWRLLDEFDVCVTQKAQEQENCGEGDEERESIIKEVYEVHKPNRWRPVLVMPQNQHYYLIGRLITWEEDYYPTSLAA